jgi:3-methyladenine DNA glycosylase AlkD
MATQIDIGATLTDIVIAVNALPSRSTAALRGVRRDFSRRLRAAPAEDVVALAYALIETTDIHRFVADELIVHHTSALQTLAEADLRRLAGKLGSWDQVDSFSLYLSGRAWRTGQVTESTISIWALSPDRWWRRVALVSTVALNLKAQGGTGDAERTLRICQLLMDDRDDMVVKAMSWALRALAVPCPEAVEGFIEENRGRLAARVVREVENKLRTGLKNPRRPTRTIPLTQDTSRYRG